MVVCVIDCLSAILLGEFCAGHPEAGHAGHSSIPQDLRGVRMAMSPMYCSVTTSPLRARSPKAHRLCNAVLRGLGPLV